MTWPETKKLLDPKFDVEVRARETIRLAQICL